MNLQSNRNQKSTITSTKHQHQHQQIGINNGNSRYVNQSSSRDSEGITPISDEGSDNEEEEISIIPTAPDWLCTKCNTKCYTNQDNACTYCGTIRGKTANRSEFSKIPINY